MTRRRRLVVLAALNGLFWIASCYIAWNRLIPDRFTVAVAFVSLLFAVPAGLCYLPLLALAELHDDTWRIPVYGSVMLANSVAWAWGVDWVWTKLTGRAPPRGFPMGQAGEDGSSAESAARRSRET